MPIAIDPKSVVEYILERERGKEGATVFHIHALKSDEDEIVARALKDNEHAFSNAACRHGLAGWSGYKFADGKDVQFVTDASGKPSTATLSCLARSDRAELAFAIVKLGSSAKSSAELEQ